MVYEAFVQVFLWVTMIVAFIAIAKNLLSSKADKDTPHKNKDPDISTEERARINKECDNLPF
jgi:hypothetical protein